MLEIVGLSSTVIMFLVVVIAATVSWGMTQLVRLMIKRRTRSWAKPLIRSVAIIVGGGMGILLVHSVLGLGLGLAAGVLNTTVVAVVKKKIKAVKIPGTDDTQPPQAP